MKKIIFLNLRFLLFLFTGQCQTTANSRTSAVNSYQANKNLFDDDGILDITVKGNIRKLLDDRQGKAINFPMTLTYKEGVSEKTIPIKIKTRGHFRRIKVNCTYPPLQIAFAGKVENSSSFFSEKSTLKLVMPCTAEKFLVNEWLVYKLYNLITLKSFRARLVRVNLEDENNKKMPLPFYGILLENEKQMAKRNSMISVKKKIKPAQTMREPFLRMAVFEYLIGNTDWSVEYMQNIKLIASDSTAVPIAVPYDFDHSGIVNASYAMPPAELEMSSVRERRYRGYCIRDMKLFDSTVALYNGLRTKIYSLYRDCPLLDDKYKKKTLDYLDDFFSTINNPKRLEKEFGYPCLPGRTGNVIIKGLRED